MTIDFAGPGKQADMDTERVFGEPSLLRALTSLDADEFADGF